MDWDSATHYAALHVAENAPVSVIRASFKALMQAHHPDRYGEGQKPEAERIAVRLNAAMDVLGDSERRRKYDELLGRREAGTAPKEARSVHEPPGSGPNGRGAPPRKIRPWPRFWARCIDYTLFGLPFGWLFSNTVDLNSALADNPVFWGLLTAAAWIPVEAFLLSTFGTTLGKRILRISVTDGHGVPGFAKALRRSVGVWWRGVAVAAPFVSTVANIVAYFDLKRHGVSSWDRRLALETVQREISTFRSIATGVATFSVMLALMMLEKGVAKIDATPVSDATTQCTAPAIWDPWTRLCKTMDETPPPLAPSSPQPEDVSADYLAMGVDVLDKAEFGQGSSEWLAEHLQYNNANDIAVIQSHLNEVLNLYPHIELRAALDMALQRALAAARVNNYAPSPPAVPTKEWAGRIGASPTSPAEIQNSPASNSEYEPNVTAEPERASSENPMPLNSIDTPSWEAIRTGHSNERVNPIDPSKVVPQASP